MDEKSKWDEETEQLADPRVKWEFIKYCICQYSAKYGKLRTKKKKMQEDSLQQELKDMICGNHRN